MQREKAQLVVRIDKELLKEVDHLAVDYDEFRGGMVERLLAMAVEQLRNQGRLEMQGAS